MANQSTDQDLLIYGYSEKKHTLSIAQWDSSDNPKIFPR